MKQVIYRRYGNVDDLEMVDAPAPRMTERDVSIDVRAVALNPLDWKILEGQMKLLTGSRFPRGIGLEFAGVVRAKGERVTRFRVGDAVYGMLDAFVGGALAEQLVVSEDTIAPKPESLSFAKAAALPIGGTSALQILDDLAPVGPGMRVLVHGATGGIGMFATQIAKRRGAIVTAVVGPRGVPFAERWGSDVVVDYTKESVETLETRYDVLVDLSGTLPYARAKTLLAPTSVHVGTLPNPKDLLASFVHNLVSARTRKILQMKRDPARLLEIGRCASEWLDVVVGREYAFPDFATAYRETRANGVVGKAIVTLDPA